MAGHIVTREKVLAEFDRIKANAYEFSDAEICILVAANLGLSFETVQQVVDEREVA